MTYDEALNFWYGRINYEVRAARPGDLKLERMAALLHVLGDPHRRVRCIHITGTKGKGSTAAMSAAILQAAGYRVGLFTSPHLSDVRERIQVNGQPIQPEELIARIEEIAPHVRKLETNNIAPPTFFEIGTALGWLHFCYRRCEIAVIEVGLGGRYDSTNVCHPLVTIITNIGYDHTAQLGPTLEDIAYQKAGIIKHGVPVVSGVTQPNPREIIRQVAREQSAPLWEWSPDLDPPPPVPLLGAHQTANASLVVAAIKQLRSAGLSVTDSAIRNGLQDVRLPARIEVIRHNPTVILDTAHNVPSVDALIATLQEAFPHCQRRSVVFAVSSDKQYPEMIQRLAKYFHQFFFTRFGNNPRSVQPVPLSRMLKDIAPDCGNEYFDSPSDAWRAAVANATKDEMICITGSVFLAGELRPLVLET